MKVALISDIHSNIYALEAVYADLKRESIDKILVNGDLIGYYYWPKEVVQLLRSDDRTVCIRGNHECILSECLSSERAAESYRKKYGSGYDECLKNLTSDEIDWLTHLPERLELELYGRSFYLSHGRLDSIDEYLYPDADAKTIESNYSSADFTVFGHTHYPFVHSKSGRFMINPGSVGQPRDSGGLASYVIVNLENLAIRFKRSLFDATRVASVAELRDPQLDYLRNIMSR